MENLNTILHNQSMYASYDDYRRGTTFGEVEFDDKFWITSDQTPDFPVIVSHYKNAANYTIYHNVKILLPNSRRLFSFDKIINIVQEVFGKNKNLKKIYKGSVGWNKPEAEEASRMLIRSYLHDLPELLNNRKKLTNVLIAERLL